MSHLKQTSVFISALFIVASFHISLCTLQERYFLLDGIHLQIKAMVSSTFIC